MTVETAEVDSDATEPASGEAVPVLYLAGIGRSGSTLLARALGEVDGLVAAGEVMHFFGRGLVDDEYCACGAGARSCPVWGRVGRRLEEEWGPVPASAIEDFRDRVVEGARMPTVFSPWWPSDFEEAIASYRRWLGRLYGELRAVTGADVVVDSSKNAAYARILQGTPGVRVHLVHLVRDSRGVANSLRKKKRRPGINGNSEEPYLDRRSPLEASFFWTAAQLMVEGIRGDAAGYRLVRYRDFVRRPAAELGRVLELVDDRSQPSELDHVGEDHVDLSRHHVLAGNPMRDEVGRIVLREDVSWRTKLGAGERRLVSALTLPLLGRYGYSVA